MPWRPHPSPKPMYFGRGPVSLPMVKIQRVLHGESDGRRRPEAKSSEMDAPTSPPDRGCGAARRSPPAPADRRTRREEQPPRGPTEQEVGRWRHSIRVEPRKLWAAHCGRPGGVVETSARCKSDRGLHDASRSRTHWRGRLQVEFEHWTAGRAAQLQRKVAEGLAKTQPPHRGQHQIPEIVVQRLALCWLDFLRSPEAVAYDQWLAFAYFLRTGNLVRAR